MGIIYEEKKDEGLLGGYPVRKTFYKNDEVLHFDKINKQWIAKSIAVTSETMGNLDGGEPDSVYGGIDGIDGEGV